MDGVGLDGGCSLRGTHGTHPRCRQQRGMGAHSAGRTRDGLLRHGFLRHGLLIVATSRGPVTDRRNPDAGYPRPFAGPGSVRYTVHA